MAATRHDPLSPPDAAAGERRSWRGLSGCATALALAALASRADHLTVVITADEQQSFRLQDGLRFFTPPNTPVRHFPDRETLPYDVFSPHGDIVSERLALLYALPRMEHGLLVVSADTLLQPLPPATFVDARTLVLNKGDKLDPIAFRSRLENAGYAAVPEVRAHGEFALRGAVLDLFPMGAQTPCRLDLFDDEIDTIRGFDPETQRSTERFDALRLLPAREFPLDDDAIAAFRQRYRQYFSGDPSASLIYRDVSRGKPPGGIEAWLPLFFDATASLFDYLPADATLIEVGDVAQALRAAHTEIESRYEQRSVDPERPLLTPEDAFVSAAETRDLLQQRTAVVCPATDDGSNGDDGVHFACEPVPSLAGANDDATGQTLRELFETFDGRLLITGASAGRREAMRDWL